MPHRLLLLITATLIPAFAAAETLTWNALAEIATAENPDLKASRAAFEADRASYRAAFNGVMPRLSLSNSYLRSDDDGGEGRWQASGSASIDLFDRSNFAEIRAASAALARSEAAYNDVSSAVLFELRSAFAGLLFAQEQTIVAERIRDIRTRNSRMVGLRYNSGRESKGNMMRARAERLQADSDLAQALRAVRTSKQQVAEALGRQEFETIATTGTLSIVPPPETVPGNIASLAESHPGVIVAAANVEAATAALDRSSSDLWPTLSASYNRSFRGSSYFPNDDPGWSASGVLSIPIFAGGPTALYHGVKAARFNLAAAEEDLRARRIAARGELEAAYAQLAAASETIEIQAAFLEAARQRNAEADIRYSNGLMSYEDWERIVTERVNFERGLIRAQRDAVIAEAAWNRAAGKGFDQ